MAVNDDFFFMKMMELSLHETASLAGSLPSINKGDAPFHKPKSLQASTSQAKVRTSTSCYTTSSSKAKPTATPGLADEVIHSFLATNADDVDLIHEDLDQIDDLDLEEMDINWQIAMLPIQIKKFTENRQNGQEWMEKMLWHLIRGKVECRSRVRGQDFKPVRLTGSFDGLLMKANQIFEKDEKLKKYRRIGMKAVKDKDVLQKIVDSWFASSKNLWKLVDCGMSSTVKMGLGYGIKSNAEVLGYEEEISRGIFAFRDTDAGNYHIPLYSRFKQVEYKGVPHPLSVLSNSIVFSICPSHDSDGELGTVFNANSTVYSSCQSNDSDGEQGTVSDHSVQDNPTNIPSIEQNWNQGMQRDLGTGYSFVRKPCFVCGSLSHLIKDCDYYEKKMAREAAFKSTRVIHANVRQVTPAWTNSNRVNKANQFTPRPVQLNNIRPNFSTASRTIKTGRVNVNSGKQHVSSGSLHVSSGTHIKSGTSSFNTGKQHVNSGSMYVNSGTKNKSGGSRVNTGKQKVNSGRVHVNTARVTSPVLSNQTSQVNFKSPKTCFSKQRSPENRPFTKNTAYKSNNYAVKGTMGTAVKTSAGCVWRRTTLHSNTNSGPTPDSNVHDHPLKHMEHRVGSVTFERKYGSISGNKAYN
ncbi:hypothetical protein Tco_1343306 [Tanacetum coccineum]